MQRVLVLGPGGAGKSVLSRDLASITGLPLVHLDREYWGPNWSAPPEDAWARRVDQLTAGPHWIIDGNHVDTLDQRLARADAVVFLDYPRRVSLGGVVTRLARRSGRRRADLAPGCRNRLDRAYLSWVWTFHRETRPRVNAALEEHAEHIALHRLRNRRQANHWLDALRQTRPTGASECRPPR